MSKDDDVSALLALCETYFTADELVWAKDAINRLAGITETK